MLVNKHDAIEIAQYKIIPVKLRPVSGVCVYENIDYENKIYENRGYGNKIYRSVVEWTARLLLKR